jgi:hypothetical protein
MRKTMTGRGSARGQLIGGGEVDLQRDGAGGLSQMMRTRPQAVSA